MEKINIVAACGSVRKGNNTLKALKLVANELKKHDNITVTIIDPSNMKIPLPGSGETSDDVKYMNEVFSKASGIVLATPEYHGSFSSVIKLIIENLGFPSTLKGKPVSLLGVAAGDIGAIKSLEALRGVCSHIGCIVLPGPLSIANVGNVFDDAGNSVDEKITNRIKSFCSNLVAYIKERDCPKIALEQLVREQAEKV